MANGELHITTTPPESPEADFALQINFVKGEGDPQRVFKAADSLIRSFKRLDRVFCSSIDNAIEPVMMLEEIESGSIKIWLKNLLSSTDDQALKDLDWKPAVGKYLVRAKYVYIQWTNKGGKDGSLLQLAKDLKNIATETDVRHLPDYAPPSIQELASVTKEIDNVKGTLIDGDSVSYKPVEGDAVDFDLTVSWSEQQLDEMVVKETTKFENMPMNLIVKKPDYLGNSKWEFRHGKKPIFASITDENWLLQFHKRQFDIRPGDALRCIVTIEHHYGFDNELIKDVHIITSINEILENQGWEQLKIIEEGD